MNPSIKNLARIAEKKRRRIIGLMSGTSLDGLDIALCDIKGSGAETEVSLLQFATKMYTAKVRDKIRKVTSVGQVSLGDLCYIHSWLGEFHGGLVYEVLHEWGIDADSIDCIASHGQTIYHLPARDQNMKKDPVNSTLQISDGDHIAAVTGIMTISDFRQKHTAVGGEGAPMASLVDELLFAGKNEHRALLNIGGIANYTYLPAKRESGYKSFTTDTGPGNTLIDNTVKQYFDKPFDKDGKIAKSGRVNGELLKRLLSDQWFRNAEAKSTGPEYFNMNWLQTKMTGLDDLSGEDIVATVSELTAATIADNMKRNLPDDVSIVIYPSGGGAHNRSVIESIAKHLPESEIADFHELGFSPDAKEAVIFAVLANEMIAGPGFTFQTKYGPEHNVNFGKISFPV
jgi:anhydro-N-acetylmuramic acid kinase